MKFADIVDSNSIFLKFSTMSKIANLTENRTQLFSNEKLFRSVPRSVEYFTSKNEL